MSRIKPYPSPRLRPSDFIQFRDDLELLLTVFTAQELASRMGKDKGNFSKKLNGVEPITLRFLTDFYQTLDPLIARARQGARAHEILEELAEPSKEESAVVIKLQVKVVDLAAGVQEMRQEIVELKTGTDEMRVELYEVRTGLQQEKAVLAEQEAALAEHAAAIRRLEEAVFGPQGPELALSA